MSQTSPVDFFIVGAPKCASTSLHDLFQQDPDYAVTNIKETHYFSSDDTQNSYYNDVPLIADLDEYHGLYKGEGTRIDICPSYFASEKAIAKLRAYNPNAKVLCLVREPIARAISHYKMDVTLGYTQPNTFEEIWRAKSGEHYDQYFGIGQYQMWIDRWRDAFGADNVFVANLVDAPFSAGKATLEAFVGRPIKAEALPVSNVANTYNLPIPLLRKMGLIKLWDALVPSGLKAVIKGLIPRKPPIKVTLSEALKEELKTFYSADYQLLEQIKQSSEPS